MFRVYVDVWFFNLRLICSPSLKVLRNASVADGYSFCLNRNQVQTLHFVDTVDCHAVESVEMEEVRL